MVTNNLMSVHPPMPTRLHTAPPRDGLVSCHHRESMITMSPDTQQMFRLSPEDAAALRLRLAEHDETRQGLTSTLLGGWLAGTTAEAPAAAITAAEVAAWRAELGVPAPGVESEAQQFRLPTPVAKRLKLAIIAADETRQGLTSVLVRAWLAGKITAERLARIRAALGDE